MIYLGLGLYVLKILGVLLIVLLILLLLKKIKIKGYSINDFSDKINGIPKSIHRKNILMGIARYLTFSHQYLLLFLAFDVNLPYLTMMATIATVYFLASSLPSFQFLDFAVKGSIGIYFFNLIGINEWIVVFITTIMWFLNIVIPIVIGGFYVMHFKLEKK